MKIVVLLSDGLHPVSGKPVLPKLEAQAVRLSIGLGEVRGLHAGPDASPASDALGHGLTRLKHVELPICADAVPSLVEALAADSPDLVIAGRRGQGGDETGLAPYAIAAKLSMAVVGDAVSIAHGEEGTILVEQALPKGARRRLVVKLPAIVTIHPDAPPAQAYAYGVARRGLVETVRGVAAAVGDRPEERPYRRRPKLISGAPAGGTAAERLAAATGAASSGGANVMVRPTPEEAAREIIAHLRAIGVLPQRAA